MFYAVDNSQLELPVIVHDASSLRDADARCDGYVPIPVYVISRVRLESVQSNSSAAPKKAASEQIR